MLLQIAGAMRREHPDRRFDFGRQRRRLFDGQAEHRLERGVGERHHCAGAPAFRQQLLDQAQPRDLIWRINTIAECIAERRGKAIASLPHVELLAS